MPVAVYKKIEAFCRQYPERLYDKGQYIMFAGDEPPCLFYLASGQVRMFDISPSGRDIVIGVFIAPTFFPVTWAINRSPNRYFFEAAVKTKLRLIPPQDFVDFIKLNRDVMYDLLVEIYFGVDNLRQRLAQVMGGSAKSRLLISLALEARQFGRRLGDGRITLKLREDELGNRAGISRETVSRILTEYRRQNIVSLNGEGIVFSLADIEEQLYGKP